MKRAFRYCTMLCLFALILTGSLLLFSQPACAESSGTCGANLTWVLDDEGTLTISGTGAMTNYSSWSPWGTGVQACVIEEGVTSIGNYAFRNCSNLTG
ncbi:MAG: hypothetical protein IKD53_08810, partial [Clostridia bacterium]|nr:hypothetical protein [Clostridia bacterium]